MWKNVLFTMWFLDFVKVFNYSYNCQNSHYLSRKQVFRPSLIFLCYNSLACCKEMANFVHLGGLLICTMISKNQGLKKSRSISNSRKISDSINLDFFSYSTLKKCWVYNTVVSSSYTNPSYAIFGATLKYSS